MSVFAAFATARSAVSVLPERLPPANLPLAAIESELATLCRRLCSLQADAAGMAEMAKLGGGGRAAHAWRQCLQQLDVHLFLTASQLLPVWRDLCRDSRTVDRMEVRLDQLRALTEQTLGAGVDDPLAEARCAVLAEALHDHRVRSVVLLRALDAVADADSLQALAEVWADQGARLRRALRQGQAPAMDNEDADPVGRPPR